MQPCGAPNGVGPSHDTMIHGDEEELQKITAVTYIKQKEIRMSSRTNVCVASHINVARRPLWEE